jgi:hypothetical protein
MDGTTAMLIEFYASLSTFGVAAAIYFVPWARKVGFTAAVTPILLVHSLRHIGLIYLLPQVVPELPPSSFSEPTAWGDVASAGAAFLALLVVRRWNRGARPAVLLFNVIGFADLGYATWTANGIQLMSYSIGVAYLLPTIVVPMLLVSHVLVFWLLWKRPPA